MLMYRALSLSFARRSLLSLVTIGSSSWGCAKAAVLSGVTVGERAVIAAAAVVAKDVEPWSVVAGNLAKEIKKRELKDDG